jgi:hypothetical protein
MAGSVDLVLLPDKNVKDWVRVILAAEGIVAPLEIWTKKWWGVY